MDRERLRVLRSALARADVVAERLLVAYRDHLDRTVRLLQATMAVLVASSATAGLLVQVGSEFPRVAVLLALVGLGAEVVALAFFALAYASLPADEAPSFGPAPPAMLRRALLPGVIEAAWLDMELRAVGDQLLHNGYVVAVLVRRRHMGVLWMAVGLGAFLSSILYIALVTLAGTVA